MQKERRKLKAEEKLDLTIGKQENGGGGVVDCGDGKSTIIVGLMQKERRKLKAEGKSDLTIGYAIYEVRI